MEGRGPPRRSTILVRKTTQACTPARYVGLGGACSSSPSQLAATSPPSRPPSCPTGWPKELDEENAPQLVGRLEVESDQFDACEEAHVAIRAPDSFGEHGGRVFLSDGDGEDLFESYICCSVTLMVRTAASGE